MSTVDDPMRADRRREMEEKVSVQGAIESIGIREVLRLALAQAPARLTLVSASHTVVLWCDDGGLAAERPGDPLEAVVDALAQAAGTFTIDATGVPDAVGPFLDLPAALAAAEPQVDAWTQVVSLVPDAEASVRLVRRVHGPTRISADQWRVLSRVGGGRTVADLAELLAVTERTSQRIVAGLASVGLLDVVRAVKPLTVPPTGPALAPPHEPDPVDLPPDEPAATVVEDLVPAAFSAPVTDASPATDTAEDAPSIEAGSDDPWLHEDDQSVERGWVDESAVPTPDDAWDIAEPVAATPPAWEWGTAEPAEVTSSWDDEPGSGTAAWTPEPSIAEAARSVPVAGPPASGPSGAVRVVDEVPYVPYVPVAEDFGAVLEPAGASDELMENPSGDEELVNRALLFKFLSSVRE